MRLHARLRLIGIILVVQAVAVGGYMMLSERFGDVSVLNQMDEIVDTVSASTRTSMEDYFNDVTRTTSAVSRAAASDANATAVENSMFAALELVPQVSGAFVADPDGSFTYAFRSDDAYATKIIEVNPERVVTLTDFDSNFEQQSTRTDPEDAYDPRTRPWYELALNEQQMAPVWTEPYTFFTSQAPGITRSVEISTETGQTRVVGVDVELTALVALMASTSDRISGEVFLQLGENSVLTRDGLATVGSGTPLKPRVATAIEARPPDMATRSVYEADGQTHVTHFISLGSGDESWTVGVDLTDDEVVAPVISALGRQRVLALVVGALAGLLLAAAFIPATSLISRLERESTTDVLTGLANRRAILRLTHAACRSDDLITVGFVDIDNFKPVNDLHGHAVGDEVLTALARRFCRTGGNVGRLGGDEFAIVLTGASAVDSVEVLRKLCSDVASNPVRTAAGEVDVTISIGTASCRCPGDARALLALADEALLHAKSLGKNSVVRATELAQASENSPSTVLR